MRVQVIACVRAACIHASVRAWCIYTRVDCVGMSIEKVGERKCRCVCLLVFLSDVIAMTTASELISAADPSSVHFKSHIHSSHVITN